MKGFYTVITPPLEPPVTLAEAKLWLRIDSDITEDDDLISALIDAATEQGEAYTGRQFVERTIEAKFVTPYTAHFEAYPFIDILRAPFNSLTSVEVTSGGSDVDITDETGIKDSQGFPRLLFYDVTNVPDDEVAYPYIITFVSGYGDADDVPEDIKTAIKQHILFMYENRGDVIPEGKESMPIITKSIYSKYRILYTYG